MAKVIATVLVNDKVVLKTWSSKKSFEQNGSWVDEKLIFACTTTDHKKDGLYSVHGLTGNRGLMMETKWTENDYSRAAILVKGLNAAGIAENKEISEEKYLQFWDTMLKLQHQLKQ